MFKELPSVFGIATDILILGYDVDGKDHDRTVRWVMQICCWASLRLNKIKCCFRCMRVLSSGLIVSRKGVQLDPRNSVCLLICCSLITQRSFQSFLYHKPPGKIFTIHCRSMPAIKKTHIHKNWVDMEQHLPTAIWVSKSIITEYAPMKFYNKN